MNIEQNVGKALAVGWACLFCRATFPDRLQAERCYDTDQAVQECFQRIQRMKPGEKLYVHETGRSILWEIERHTHHFYLRMPGSNGTRQLVPYRDFSNRKFYTSPGAEFKFHENESRVFEGAVLTAENALKAAREKHQESLYILEQLQKNAIKIEGQQS